MRLPSPASQRPLLADTSIPDYGGLGVDGLLMAYEGKGSMRKLHIEQLIGMRLGERILESKTSTHQLLAEFRAKAPTRWETITGEGSESGELIEEPIADTNLLLVTSADASESPMSTIVEINDHVRMGVYLRVIRTLALAHGFEFEDYRSFRDHFGNGIQAELDEDVRRGRAASKEKGSHHKPLTFDAFNRRLEEWIVWFGDEPSPHSKMPADGHDDAELSGRAVPTMVG